MKKFGWSKEFVYQTFFVLGDVNMNNLNIIHSRNMIEEGTACDCMHDLGCTWGTSS